MAEHGLLYADELLAQYESKVSDGGHVVVCSQHFMNDTEEKDTGAHDGSPVETDEAVLQNLSRGVRYTFLVPKSIEDTPAVHETRRQYDQEGCTFVVIDDALSREITRSELVVYYDIEDSDPVAFEQVTKAPFFSLWDQLTGGELLRRVKHVRKALSKE